MAVFKNYNEFLDRPKITCPKCDWTGPGGQTKVGDTFGALTEYRCPRCDGYLALVTKPVIESRTQ